MRLAGTVLLTVLAGCSSAGDPAARRESQPDSADLRVQLATDWPQPGFAEVPLGHLQKVYVSPAVELNNMDVVTARALHSEKRSMIQIVLNRLAADRLFQLTRDHVGSRMAVFIDDELISAPPIYGPDASGELRIVGQFSRKRAERLAANLSNRSLP